MDHMVDGISIPAMNEECKWKPDAQRTHADREGSFSDVCAICMDQISLVDVAYIKGCEHVYCVMCILRWASYNALPCCPQCKTPFTSLNMHRSLDGCVHDYLEEESVCLLLRTPWFTPLTIEAQPEAVEPEEPHLYDYDDDNADDYYEMPSHVRIGNRRWGDNGFVRSGRKEARPVANSQYFQNVEAGSSHGSQKASKQRSRRQTRN